MKKLNIIDIKNYIESNGYKLLSKEYIGCNKKLKILCKNGKIIEITYTNFKQAITQNIKLGTKQKSTYNEVKNYIESNGYKLLSKEYKKCKDKICLSCPENHIIKIRYSAFKQGERCLKCFQNNKKISYSDLKNKIESIKGYKLISKTYKNNKNKINIKCNFGHIFSMRYNDFQSGHRCPICDNQKTVSIGEKEIANYIKSIYDGKIIENDRTQIINPKTGNYLELDIFLPELNKAIEYNGKYWHTTYKDNLKLKLSIEKNIDLLIIEDEKWRKNKDYNIIKYFIYKTNKICYP